MEKNLAAVNNIQGLIAGFMEILQKLVPLAMGFGLLYFFWGLARFIRNASSEDAQTEAKQIMLWGIIVFVVMLSLWGIVAFVRTELGINSTLLDGMPSTPTGECQGPVC